MPQRRRTVRQATRARLPKLWFERLETRAMLTADVASAVACEPAPIDETTVDDGGAWEVALVDPPEAEIFGEFAPPWLAYAQQGDRGFLVIHVSGIVVDGVPDVTMEIVAMRLNNADAAGDPADESSVMPMGDVETLDDGSCVVFDALEENPEPILIPTDASDSFGSAVTDGPVDWYMVVQSKSDFALGLMAFVVVLTQSGGDAGWSSDAALPSVAPDPALAAAASLGIAANVMQADPLQAVSAPVRSFAAAEGASDAAARPAVNTPVGQTQPAERAEASGEVREEQSDTALDDAGSSSLDDCIRPALIAGLAG